MSYLCLISLGLHPTLYLKGTGGLCVKQPNRNAAHPPPPTVELRNEWNFTSILPYVFMA
jgi:hypothetical protein